MQADGPDDPAHPRPTVFLSYASEDRSAAQRIRDALPAFGMEVWYDESDLVGGDAWDQKIRGQIRACDYFMPVISAHTEARHEGYFRREWRLAVERTLDMADDHVFLLPVVIDATAEAGARVPDKFRAVQWLRVPEGRPTAALEAVCRRLVSGESAPRPSGERARPKGAPAGLPAGKPGDGAKRPFPPFPREEPGQRTRFWFEIGGWLLQSGWTGFQRFPRWVRVLVYIWVATFLMSLWGRSHVHDDAGISAPQAAKLKEIAASHPGNWTAADTARLIAQIAKEIPADDGDAAAKSPVLAIPFAAPQGDAAAQKLAASVFTQVCGRLALSRHGRVALSAEPTPDAAAAEQQGRAHHSTYTLYGSIAGTAPNQQLTVKVLSVADGSTSWSKSYPVAGADPEGIAAEISAHVPDEADD